MTVSRWDADTAVEQLYATHYRRLVRLAVLLVRDVETAEEVVQDSFVAMHGTWRTLREPDQGLAYLRQTVVNRSRSVPCIATNESCTTSSALSTSRTSSTASRTSRR